jgi:hypothetical protein
MPVRFMTDSDNVLRAIPDAMVVDQSTTATDVDRIVFTAAFPCELVSVVETHSTAGTDGSAVSLDIKKATGTTAPASGTTMLASTFNLKSTANTPVTKNGASGLTATLADRKLATGDRVCFDFTGTLTALVGHVTIYLKRLQTAGGAI